MDRHSDDPGRWLRNFTPSPGARLRMVCFPHAGGAATAYHPMSVALSPEIDVLAVQYPGRQDRLSESCVDSIPELVDLLVPLLIAQTDHRPLALFGHSMGATVAFEIARRLEREPGTGGPAILFLSGRRAPHFKRNDYVHLRDDQGVLKEVQLLGGSATAALSNPELLSMVLPAIRSDYRAVETHVHVPGPPLRCPVVALTGDADPRADTPSVEAWRDYTEGPFASHVFPGGHFFLNDRADEVHSTVRSHVAALPGRGARAQ
ncbi:thioesterase II family protein [Streptomyces jumonjinensis]|uniref:Thioesterase n=1 Tax=Streptomyces jumonjinensis TaxID=1945 RepID=A0A646KEA8_STRJU|nr:alpha/beta fold hydrolase [Streptomyces jumonjinensis]MQT00458.1 thioesterase [Streptomyces jumonjinensis]